MIWIAGRQYGSAAQIAAALGADVTVGMVREWAEPDRETQPHRAGRVA